MNPGDPMEISPQETMEILIFGMEWVYYRWCLKSLAKLVQITPISLGFMVYIYIYLLMGW